MYQNLCYWIAITVQYTSASHFKVSFTQVVQLYFDICLKMCCIMGDVSLAVSFSIFAGMSDGPGQTFSHVVNVTVIGFGQFFGG